MEQVNFDDFSLNDRQMLLHHCIDNSTFHSLYRCYFCLRMF